MDNKDIYTVTQKRGMICNNTFSFTLFRKIKANIQYAYDRFCIAKLH